VVGKLEVFVFGDLLRAAAEQSFQGFTAVAHPVLERDSDLRHRFCQSNEHLKAASCHRLLKKANTNPSKSKYGRSRRPELGRAGRNRGIEVT